MRKLTKAQIDKMTPEQRGRVAREISAVMVSAMAIKKARARIAELENAQANRLRVQKNVAEVVKAIEDASPSDRILLALMAARAGQWR